MAHAQSFHSAPEQDSEMFRRARETMGACINFEDFKKQFTEVEKYMRKHLK
jgi:hypothetical protein